MLSRLLLLVGTRWWWSVVAAAALLALLLGLWGFAVQPAPGDQPLTGADVFYRTLQLFVLSWEWVKRPTPWPLEIARFLAAFAAFSTVVGTLIQIFRQRAQLALLRWMDGHVVLCGLGPDGVKLVEGLRRRGEQVVVVEPSAHHAGLELCRELGALTLTGPTNDEALLRRLRLSRARALLALFQEDDANIRTALAVERVVSNGHPSRLHCVVHVSRRELRELLHRHQRFLGAALFREAGPTFEVEFFNLHEVGAEVMLRESPLLYEGKTPERLLVVGGGLLGEALLARAARDWLIDRPAPDRKLKITVVDNSAEKHEPRLRRNYPILEQVCELTFLPVDVTDPAFREGKFLAPEPPDAAFVCLGDETLSFLAASRLHERLAGVSPRPPVIVRMSSASGLAALLAPLSGQGVRVVSTDELARNHGLVLNFTRELMAQTNHQDYMTLRFRRGAKRGPGEPGLVPWNQLDSELQESNRDQVTHVPTKLRAVGCRAVPVEQGTAVSLLEFTPQEVEKLAALEHDRWIAERTRAGWRYGAETDRARRINKFMVPYEKLPENVKDYDRDPVRRLPGNLARMGFAVVREQATQA